MSLSNPAFEASYRRLFGDDIAIAEDAQVFFRDFYRRFLADPEVAALFVGVDLERQVSMLRKSLYHLVAYYLFDESGAELQRIAMVHRQLGIKKGLFNVWLQALIETVAVHDPEFDESVGLAWCWAMSPGITYMKIAPVDH